MDFTEAASVYIPMDRRQAMAGGGVLPERVHGAALFADISGFTPLTEALAAELGPQRGAEELARHLNLVYDALIAQLDSYQGAVIGFSGDAITCWLNGDDGARATACALQMQQTMRQFATVTTASGSQVSLAVKIAVAVGPARRFLVGDPQIQLIDVLSGSTLDSLAAAEHQAGRGEIVVDRATMDGLGERVRLAELRREGASGRDFGVVIELLSPPPPDAWPSLPQGALSQEACREWLLPRVYERLAAGFGEFLAELRPAVALFTRFGGLDYDLDEEAGAKLDAFIRDGQRVLARYDGSLIQLTLGDKGSYLYAAFGAPVAHEDDAVRAVSAAVELQGLAANLDYMRTVQIGVTQGRMRTGAYGSAGRRTYGVLGDAVNLSARLMQQAQTGQVLATTAIAEATGDCFAWETLPPIQVKGKSAPVAVSRLIGRKERASLRLQEPAYALPMVGRGTELALIAEKLDVALAGRGQIIGITAEAGMGKSRLAAEAIRLALARGFAGYGGECQSYGTNTSYLVWRDIWRCFFDVDTCDAPDTTAERLSEALSRLDPSLLPRLPLLGAAVNVALPDNDVTRGLDPKLRKTGLETLLTDVLAARASAGPLLLALEDCHWLDPLSRDLLAVIGRAIAGLPVALLLAFRPPDEGRRQELPIRDLPHFTEIRLAEFTPEEAHRLIGLKLKQFFGGDWQPPSEFAERITAHAEGNPFYIEELLNYIRDKGVDLNDAGELARLDLPVTLESLVLSRIDQLAENPRAVLRVASVVGRVFRAAMLWDVHPALGQSTDVLGSLNLLSSLELTPVDDEPEQTYLFKHIVTREVTYDSLPFAMRAVLHDQIARHLEQAAGENWEQVVDLLAHHFDRSENLPKRREYLRKAGEAAQVRYANAAAIDYFERLLPLLEEEDHLDALIKLAQVLELVGRWPEARARYERGLEEATALGDICRGSMCKIGLGELLRKQGSYAEAESWYEQARAASEARNDWPGVAKALICAGSLAWQKGDREKARDLCGQSLALRRELDDKPNIANALNNLGILARQMEDPARARAYYEESLTIRRELRNKWGVANSLNNLGNLARQQGDLDAARAYLTEAVTLQREIGDKWAIANSLNNLANVARDLEDNRVAAKLYRESFALNSALGDRWALAYLLEDAAALLANAGAAQAALRLAGAAESVRETIGAPLPGSEQQALAQRLSAAWEALGPDLAGTALSAGRAASLGESVGSALEELSCL
jgi:adenylate cyclase